MEKLKVEVQYKISWLKREKEYVEVVKGSSVDDLLKKISFSEDLEHLLLVFNGKTIFAEDPVTESGRLLIVSSLIGG